MNFCFQKRVERSSALKSVLILGCAAAVSFAHAKNDSAIGVVAKAGSAGGGLDLILKVSETLKVRAGWSMLQFTGSDNEQGADYHWSADIAAWNALIDWHAAGNGFRLTGGVYAPNFKLAENAAYNSDVRVGPQTYKNMQLGTLRNEFVWNKPSPYLGLGYDGFNSTPNGLFFTGDLGVLYIGSSSVNSSAYCMNGVPAASCNKIQTEMQNSARISRDYANTKFFPLLQVGIGYRF